MPPGVKTAIRRLHSGLQDRTPAAAMPLYLFCA
jgi:hypothetical protein